MRMRKKPWARPELAACPYFSEDPAAWIGHWREHFARASSPFWVELGCGKGAFIAPFAAEHPEINFLAVDIKSEVLAVARRTAEQAFEQVGRTADNLLLTSYDIERIDRMLASEDRVERILIFFCNPWPKERCHKHRLTHTRQLARYRALLAPGGKLVFKTDDNDLFLATLRYLAQADFQILEQCENLPLTHPTCAFMSEHERMFREQGIPIKYLVAAVRA